jgi:YD repeat-containing protein
VYSITAKAKDDNGGVTSSSAVAIDVLSSSTYHSLSVNGTSGYVSVPNSSTIDISGPITVEAWVKVNAITGNYQDILCREAWGQAGTGGGYEFAITSTGKVRLDLYQSPSQYTTVIGATTATTNTWHHVAGVFDGNQMRVYLDGVLDGSLSTTNGPASGTSALNIGKSTYTTYYFGGLIDEVRLSAAALYSSNFTPGLGAGSNTRGLWKFDGQTTNDVSGNGNHGILQTGATYSTDVPPSNSGSQRPLPVAGGPYTGQPAQSMQFSSSGSFDPDGTIVSYHWNFGDGSSVNTASPAHTYAAPGLYTATLTVTDNAGLRASATAAVTINGDGNSRLDPLNQTGGDGENPLSRNFNWTLPLVSLPGRAGMDLNLSLSYNSLVWTKSGSYISFDDDFGFPGPGFRLGFPVIHPLYYNSEVGKYAYLVIGSDGSRTELRQVPASTLYEAADSSHLLLDASTMVLRTTDGTQFKYEWKGVEYNCTEIKDRNGNYMTVNYTSFGRIDTIIDTLARSIKFNYDGNGRLTSITQVWNQDADHPHVWATFDYEDTTIETNFTNLTVSGSSNSSTLSKVTLADGSHYDFTYTNWGQIWKISSFAADNHLLNYRAYNLPGSLLLASSPQSDCPRFTERRDWAENWNQNAGGVEQAVTTYAAPLADTWSMPNGWPHDGQVSGKRADVTSPDGTLNKIYFIDTVFINTIATPQGWQRGLPSLVVTYDNAGSWRRKSMTIWTQDNTSVSYPLNPRITETNVYDSEGNRARVRVTYQTLPNTSCQFPRDVYEYAADASTILRSTRTDYNSSATYIDRRIMGVVSEKRLYEGDVNNGGTLAAKVGLFYDNENGASSIQGTDAPVQHDNTNYSATFVTGRANLSSVRRYDVTNTSQFTTTNTKYNTAGAVISSTDASNHVTQFSYADSFSDGTPRNTLAYPTMLKDPDQYEYPTKYNFDFGAVTYRRTPKPNATTDPDRNDGPEQILTYDPVGRLQQVTNQVNSAYTRYVYSSAGTRVDTYATIQEGLGEAHSFKITDGAGRVIATAIDHPGSTGGYSGQRFSYDVMGRVVKTSNPTETSASGAPSQWATAGDDASAGWIYAQQTYDWKGRPLVTTNQDGTTKTASYSGCGCAGGEVATLIDEGTIDNGIAKKRQQKIYKDVLGRVVKTETLNWEGGSIYSTTVNTYNARDQITQVRQYSGSATSGTYQDTTMTFDGYGRVQSKHVPEENNGTATTWTYNADDSVNTVTDARGAVTTLGYAGTNRGLVKTVTHTLTGSPQINVSYNYDAVGNRILMADSLGTVSYGYDQLSRMTSETRTFSGIGSFTLSYTYNLAGELASFTSFGNSISYTRDVTGRLTGVSGSPVGGVTQYVSNIKYRAWGGRREVTYGNNHTGTTQYNSRRLPTSYSLSNAMTRNYTYYADGRLETSSLAEDGTFNRAYEYDHAGRLDSDSTPTNFAQNLTYDVWGNVTESVGWHWSQFIIATENYSNNRNSNWQYNAAGQVTSNQTMSSSTMPPGEPLTFGRRVGSAMPARSSTTVTVRSCVVPTQPFIIYGLPS